MIRPCTLLMRLSVKKVSLVVSGGVAMPRRWRWAPWSRGGWSLGRGTRFQVPSTSHRLESQMSAFRQAPAAGPWCPAGGETSTLTGNRAHQLWRKVRRRGSPTWNASLTALDGTRCHASLCTEYHVLFDWRRQGIVLKYSVLY